MLRKLLKSVMCLFLRNNRDGPTPLMLIKKTAIYLIRITICLTRYVVWIKLPIALGWECYKTFHALITAIEMGMYLFSLLLFFIQFVCVESLVTAVVDMYPKIFRRGYRREMLILALSIVSYFLGLIMLTEVRYI